MQQTNGSASFEKDGMKRLDNFFTYSEEEKQENEINKDTANLVFSPKFIPVYPKLLDVLTMTEAFIFGFIDFYLSSGENKRMYFEDKQLSKICKCSENTISSSIKKLKEIGLINTTRRIKEGGGSRRFIYLNSDSPLFGESQTTKRMELSYIKENNKRK